MEKNNYIMSEGEIQNSILEWLHFKKIVAWRNNSMATYDSNSNSYRRKSKYDRNGVSDILAILPCGKFLAIEVKKNSKCKPSKDQKDFIKDIKKNEGVAFVAWSVKQVARRLKKYIE